MAVSLAIRHHTTTNTPIKAVRFITTNLLPPPKKAVLAALRIPLTPGGQPEPPIPIVRKAESDVSNSISRTASFLTSFIVFRCGERVRRFTQS
jgi:primary-amine oxidase